MARLLALFALLAGLLAGPPAAAEDRFITLASTTSTEQSGLFAHLLPLFTKETGIAVHVVALGTGQALRVAANGDADAVLVHDRAAEEKFVADGFGIDRRGVMYNDFVLVGPAADPAGVKGYKDAAEAFWRLAAVGVPFISRGDGSGTHAMENRLWHAAGRDPAGERAPWYLAAGQGMGPTLGMAAARDAYTLCDRGTWLGFRDRGGLGILVEGDPRLFNSYGIILVNPARFPHVKAAEARRFSDWLVSAKGQAAIAAFRIDGRQLFVPNARRE